MHGWSGIVRLLGTARYRRRSRRTVPLRPRSPGGQYVHGWSGIVRPLGIARYRHIALNRSKNVGADALIGPPRKAMPAPAKFQLPGNPREVRTTFSPENGCCAPRAPADIGCLLRNSIQNLPFRQRYAGKTVHLCCRSPHGERGLKYHVRCRRLYAAWSLPPRGAWIEIHSICKTRHTYLVAPPTGSVD